MGFFNINGNTVHTSAIGIGLTGISSNTATMTTSSSGQYISANVYGHTTFTSQKTEYNLMGEVIKIEGYADPHIAHLISSINVLGWKYYEEFKKQNINITGDILKFLEKGYKSHQRDQKISDIIGD